MKNSVATVKQEANEKNRTTIYHLFGDNWDDWYETRKEADEAYKKAVDEAEGNINIRLYREVNENEETTEEYIKGRGDFPW